MNYICQNCGATGNEQKELCNPILDTGDSKLCKDWSYSVCVQKASEVGYFCACGNVSKDPKFLCNPEKI